MNALRSMLPRTPRLLSTALALALVAPSALAQACGQPQRPADCKARVAGTPLPYANSAAPVRLDLGAATTVDIEILGHSESRGYHRYLQPLLTQQPPIPNVTFRVTNRFIGGHEAWRWATPGQRGYQTIQSVIAPRSNPVIVLGLFSNNNSYPIQAPNLADANYKRFVDDLEKIADALDNSGNGVLMSYFSAHRYKPTNPLPCFYENCAIGELMRRASSAKKAYLKPGPEQHDLHWCCHSSCYAADNAHTNAAGDQLMAQAWYALLVRELTGCAVEPYGAGTPGSSALVPVLGARGGAPKLGNAQFALHASDVRPSAPLVYLLGAQRLAGPLVLASPDIVLVALADASGEHALGLPIPTTSSLHGARVMTQALALDSASSASFSATQGLQLDLCR